MKFYVFIQNEPFYLPKVLDKVLREFGDDCMGVNIQSVAQGKRSVVGTAMDLLKLYGFGYFQWKFRRYIWKKIQGKVVNDILGSTRTCHSVGAVARRYGVEVTSAVNVTSDEFRAEPGALQQSRQMPTALGRPRRLAGEPSSRHASSFPPHPSILPPPRTPPTSLDPAARRDALNVGRQLLKIETPRVGSNPAAVND